MIPISVSQIETTTLTGWPALKVAHDGLWIWRYANGYTKRANCMQCLEPTDGGYAEYRLLRFAEMSRRHSIPAVFRVTPLTAPEILVVLDGLLWEEFEHSLVLAMEMPLADFPVSVQTRQFAPDDPQWLRAQANLAGHDPQTMATLEAIVRSIACEARGVLVYHKAGLPVASALVTVVGAIAVYVNVVTHPSARGMGYGRAAMSAALNAARAMGATHSAIQVLADNEPALNLYASLGFGEVYSYSYRRAPDWSTR